MGLPFKRSTPKLTTTLAVLHSQTRVLSRCQSIALSLRHLFPGGGVAAVYSVAEYVAFVHAAWEAAHGEQLATWYSAYIVSDR